MSRRAEMDLAEITTFIALRSCVHGAYVIFFKLDDPGVRIERILHESRDLRTLLDLWTTPPSPKSSAAF